MSEANLKRGQVFNFSIHLIREDNEIEIESEHQMILCNEITMELRSELCLEADSELVLL